MDNDLYVPELSVEELEDSAKPLAVFLSVPIRHILTTGKLNKVNIKSVYRSELVKLKKKYPHQQAIKILKAAVNSTLLWIYKNNVDSFKEGGNIIAAQSMFFMHTLDASPSPIDVQKALAEMITDFSRTRTMSKGESQSTILEATGIDVCENKTTMLTKLYYELRKFSETTEEKRNRRSSASKIGKNIDQVVAEELNMEVPALKKRLRKQDTKL
jgi:hypothetical protein